jgi:hypothetical protein
MLQITPQMRIFVAVEAVDFRNGIDGLVRLCKEVLLQDPFRGGVFVFRNPSYNTGAWPRRVAAHDCSQITQLLEPLRGAGRAYLAHQGRTQRAVTSGRLLPGEKALHNPFCAQIRARLLQ